MKKLFEYANYHEFLSDWFKAHKTGENHCSYQTFAERAGFQDKSSIHAVVTGRRDLSKNGVYKFIKALQLNKKETKYFRNLVGFNQAGDLATRKSYFERMNSIRTAGAGVQARIMRQDQYDYYAQWWNSAIRSYIGMHPFKNDFKLLARSLYPAIKPMQAKRSVRLLEKLGLIKKGKTGTYVLTEKHISTGKEVAGLGVLDFHDTCTKLACAAMAHLPRSERHVSGMTLGVSRKCYEKISEEIMKFQQKINKMSYYYHKAHK